MDFQVLSVALEDRYPPALPAGTRREDLLAEGFFADKGPAIQPYVEGCIAFVFGRNADGQSVCVRVRACARASSSPSRTASPPAPEARLEDRCAWSCAARRHPGHAPLLLLRLRPDPDRSGPQGLRLRRASYPNQMAFRRVPAPPSRPRPGPSAGRRTDHGGSRRAMRSSASVWTRVADPSPSRRASPRATSRCRLSGRLCALLDAPRSFTTSRRWQARRPSSRCPWSPRRGVASRSRRAGTVAAAGHDGARCNTEADVLRTTRRLVGRSGRPLRLQRLQVRPGLSDTRAGKCDVPSSATSRASRLPVRPGLDPFRAAWATTTCATTTCPAATTWTCSCTLRCRSRR